MIEFKHDSSFRVPQASDSGGQWIIGLGTSGVNVLDQLVLENEGVRDLIVLDTDETSIRGSVVMEKYLIGKKIIRGMGTGGDPDLASQLFKADQSEIREMLKGTRLAVIVAGLGGGTASGMLTELVEVLRDLGAATIVVTATPFVFEGSRRRSQAMQSLSRLKISADAVLCFSNQSLMQVSDDHADVRLGFTKMNSLLAKVAMTLRRAVSQRGLMQVSLADIRQLAHDTGVATEDHLLCRAGCASAEGANRVEDVVEQVLASPLLQDERLWVRGHSLLASLTGGADMSMSEFQSVMKYLRKQLPVEIPMVTAANVDKNKKQHLELTLMVTGNWEEMEESVPSLKPQVQQKPLFETEIKKNVAEQVLAEEAEVEIGHEEETWQDKEDEFEETPVMAHSGHVGDEENEPEFDGFACVRSESNKMTPERYFDRQEELPLDKKIPRGRFEKSSPTMWDGQDLDQPTFMRMGIKIKI
jgi:cell division protein FtsZ